MSDDLQARLKRDYPEYFQKGNLGVGVWPGWENLVETLVRDIKEIGGKIDILQVKEKFAGLQFYYYRNHGEGEEELIDKIRALVKDAERRSYIICEFCSAPGGHCLTESGWSHTACDECAKAKNFTKTPEDDE